MQDLIQKFLISFEISKGHTCQAVIIGATTGTANKK